MNTEIKEVRTCPLGSKCIEIKDNELHKCMWLIKVQGENPLTGENEDSENCAIAFTPIAVLEAARWSRGTQSAVEGEREAITQLAGVLKNVVDTATQNKLENRKPDVTGYLENGEN